MLKLTRLNHQMVAIEVRTPSSSSLEYARLKVEAAATLARTLPETCLLYTSRCV